jgi:hypothetical protein
MIGAAAYDKDCDAMGLREFVAAARTIALVRWDAGRL